MRILPSVLPVLAALTACRSERASAPTGPVVLLHEEGVENAYPRLSVDGREVLYQSNRGGTWQLFVLDLATKASRQLTREGNNNLPDWSPDGRQIAFVSDRDGNEEIYVIAADGSEPRRLTTSTARDIHPYWAPDGKSLLFNSDRDGSLDVFELVLATGDVRKLTSTPEDDTCARYAPDGQRMVFLRNSSASDDIWIAERDGTARDLTNTPGTRDGWPVFGPGGRWVYFAGMDGGGFSIYRMRPDGSAREQLTHAAPEDEDARPFVARDGSRLVFNRRSGSAIDILALSCAC